MSDHVCKESRTCCCGNAAIEPAERCPIHGCGDWPPRCGICGKFLAHDSRQREFDMEISRATQEGDTLILTADVPIETPEGWQRVK